MAITNHLSLIAPAIVMLAGCDLPSSEHAVGRDTVRTFGKTRRYQIGRTIRGLVLSDAHIGAISSRVEGYREVGDFAYVLDDKDTLFVINMVSASHHEYAKDDAIPMVHQRVRQETFGR